MWGAFFFSENMTIFFRVGFCVFQAWGCKVPSRNIRQFFWKIYRGFFGLGAGYIPKRYEKFFVEKDKCFQGNFFCFLVVPVFTAFKSHLISIANEEVKMGLVTFTAALNRILCYWK